MKSKESWALEIALALVIGVPWYFFSPWLWLAVLVHVLLAGSYFLLVTLVFGRGSAITSFLFLFLASVFVGLLFSALVRAHSAQKRGSSSAPRPATGLPVFRRACVPFSGRACGSRSRQHQSAIEGAAGGRRVCELKQPSLGSGRQDR